MARQKKEETPEKIEGSNDRLKSIMKEYESEHYNNIPRVDWKISTGSLMMDVAVGGYLTPSLIRMCGQNNEGKTPQTLEILRQFLATVPNSKGFWMIAEGRGLSKENRERCGLKFVYTADEWVPGTVFVLESNVYELFIKCVKDLVLNNPEKFIYCFVVDSIDGLMLRDDKKKEITEANKVAGCPSLSKKLFQNLSLGMFKYGHLMILISQVTAEIKLDQYTKAPNRGGEFSGGNSLLHQSDWIFEYQKTFNGDYILDDPNGKLNDGKSKPVGKNAKVVLVKSAVEKTRKMQVIYPIKFGRTPSGIWLEQEVADLMIGWELVKKGGAWFSFEPTVFEELKKIVPDVPEKFQGINNLRIYLEEHADITKYLYEKLKTAILGE